jgi:hypothetical protein
MELDQETVFFSSNRHGNSKRNKDITLTKMLVAKGGTLSSIGLLHSTGCKTKE